jgi:hypothetical protein
MSGNPWLPRTPRGATGALARELDNLRLAIELVAPHGLDWCSECGRPHARLQTERQPTSIALFAYHEDPDGLVTLWRDRYSMTTVCANSVTGRCIFDHLRRHAKAAAEWPEDRPLQTQEWAIVTWALRHYTWLKNSPFNGLTQGIAANWCDPDRLARAVILARRPADVRRADPLAFSAPTVRSETPTRDILEGIGLIVTDDEWKSAQDWVDGWLARIETDAKARAARTRVR